MLLLFKFSTTRPNLLWNNGNYWKCHHRELAADNFLIYLSDAICRKLHNCTECIQNVQSTYKLSSNIHRQVFWPLLFRLGCHQRQHKNGLNMQLRKYSLFFHFYLIEMNMNTKRCTVIKRLIISYLFLRTVILRAN